ncbi:MAG TPA: L,D-transpeptidase family protein [Candidatus Akkermansia intestinigallinarum]|uniref:L,D-transpeptidase family protein n=1 Tax=Candidatus Akkermansia intestinigallinarum TaxID=2838431 RepID=A0A9D1V9E0_9BACT|nr:L,D-transpeptidase family protein [Candidatus Akkermansia intestinigallinarum]
MKTHSLLPTLCLGLAALLGLSSCSSVQENKPAPPQDKYQRFVHDRLKYPKTMEYYENSELLKKATAQSPIYICLDQQRGRLYVDGQVAADWPVSTGVEGHLTPTGKYKVRFKQESYRSGRYGKIYDQEGKIVNGNADILNDEVPEGGKFVGSSMPYWQRLTADGVGMHTGRVVAGKRLSHGCIRTPNYMARKLYGITKTGITSVSITQAPEAIYPAHQQLADNAKRKAEAEAAEARRKAEKKTDTGSSAGATVSRRS